MSGFFEQLFHRDTSAYQAKERMKLVLINDRINMSSSALDNLKTEIIGVISRYVEIDQDAVRFEMKQDGRQQRLIADIPLKSSRRKSVG